VYVAVAPLGRLTVPATVLPVEPLVLQVPPPAVEHVTATDPTVVGTESLIDAVPGPQPVFLTVIV
jgi:hypothetical protein